MKKFCEKCGLRHDLTDQEQKEGQFICKECNTANLGILKEKLKEKMARFEACPKCGLVRKGEPVRKINDVVTIKYQCNKCNFGWMEDWVKKPLKERLKNAVKKP